MLTIIFTEASTAEGVRARPCDAEEEMTVRAKLVVPGRRRKKCPLGLTCVFILLYFLLFC